MTHACALSTLMWLGAFAFVVGVAGKLWRAAFPRGMATYTTRGRHGT
jgi:hypothetical protein